MHAVSKINRVKYHQPNEKLINYMKHKSRLEHRRDSLETRGNKLSKSESDEINNINKKLRYLKNDKVKLLDNIIFPSMANLTFFFESISEIPKLRENFESDISELLGIRRIDPKSDNFAFMFRSLLNGIIMADKPFTNDINIGDEKIYVHSDDFRLRLIHDLQRLISSKVSTIPIFKSSRPSEIIMQDIHRVLAWTQMIASRVSDEYDLNLRTQNPQKFKTEVKNNRPSRTFDFDTKKILQDVT